MDYEYLLYVERDALADVLVRLGDLVDPSDEPTVLHGPDRTVVLPYATWADTPHQLSWDDPASSWQFAITLCFDPDEAITDYLRPRHALDPAADSPQHFDARGRARIGYVYLTVHRQAPDGLALLSFGTPGSSMSVLFSESDSIRRTFVGLLESGGGVYGVFDREDPADLFWWRGREVDVRLPTAEMSLADIEELAQLSPPGAP